MGVADPTRQNRPGRVTLPSRNIWGWATVNPPNSPPSTFDYHHVLSRVMILCVNDLAWQTYFAEYRISPYTIVYEDFFSDLGSSLPALIDYLGGVPEHGALKLATTLAVQRVNVSAEWVSRFRRYLNRVGDLNEGAEFGCASKVWSDFFFGLGWRR